MAVVPERHDRIETIDNTCDPYKFVWSTEDGCQPGLIALQVHAAEAVDVTGHPNALEEHGGHVIGDGVGRVEAEPILSVVQQKFDCGRFGHAASVASVMTMQLWYAMTHTSSAFRSLLGTAITHELFDG